MRQWSPRKDGRSLWWKVTARNKRLVTLDLREPSGRRLFLRLVEWADAVVENYGRGRSRWGSRTSSLRRSTLASSSCASPATGKPAPTRTAPGTARWPEAFSGLPTFTGFPDGPPTLSAFLCGHRRGHLRPDRVVGGGVRARRGGKRQGAGGRRQPVRTAVPARGESGDRLRGARAREGAARQQDRGGLASQRVRHERRRLDSDLGELGSHLPATCRGDRRPELPDDPRFRDNPSRIANDVELDRIVADWMRERTTAQVMDALEAQDVVAGPVLDIAGIFADARARKRRGARRRSRDGSDAGRRAALRAAAPTFALPVARRARTTTRSTADPRALETEIAELRRHGVV